MLRRTLALAVAAGGLALTTALPLAANPLVIQVNSSQPAGSFADVFLTEFKNRLEAELPGQVDVQIFLGNTLGSEEDVLQGMRLGTHTASLSASAVAQINRRAAVFDLPYLFETRDDVQRFATSPAGELLAEGFDGTGVRLLALWDNGFRSITNSVRPITTPADLAGLKIRTPTNRQRVEMFNVLGANATPLSFGETYSGLDQGVVDGQENPVHVVISSRFYEVQDYLSLSNHVYLPTFLLFSESFLNRIDPDIRATIERVAVEVAPWTFAWGDETDAAALAELDGKIAVNRVDFAAFQEASLPLFESPVFVDVIGADMVEATLAAVKGN